MKSINFANEGIEKTKVIIKQSENEVTFWDYEDGIEYSTDVFYNKGKLYFIRICEKIVRIINNRPCTIAYRLINPEVSMTESIESWCNSIYEKNNISFAQFDFIKRNSDNSFLPIDFSSRVAGGLHTLLRQLSYNPYLNALLLRGCNTTASNRKLLGIR